MEKINMKTFSKRSYFSVKKNHDIFSSSLDRINSGHNGCTVLIPHVCNNINVFGGGFSGDISKNFPTVKENFHLLGNKAKLGQVQNILVSENKNYGNKLYVCNMIAQNGIKNSYNLRPLNYGALAHSMTEVKNFAKSLSILNKEENNKIEIHAPKFGSGLAGGNWEFISLLIEDIWSHLDVYIYTPTIKK
jgi:hypothetical protein